jgi:glycosyltransferase involved in cell wall biosynthesis
MTGKLAEARPEVSILLPVRNEERFLPAALASLLRQTLESWELVAVDDGSTDATPDILAAVARRDARVKVLLSPQRGLVPALNAGLAACRAPLVARMDGDDIAHPRRLELQQAFMAANPKVGLVACAFRHFPRQRLGAGMLAYEAWQNSLTSHETIIRDLFVESPFVHPGVMFRRETVERVGGYRNLGWPEDYDLWLRLAAAGISFARLAQPLLFWRERPERATRTMDEYTATAFRACKVHHLKRSFLRNVAEITLAGAGLEGRAWCRALALEGVRVSRWVDVDPRKIGRTLHGAPVVGAGEVTSNGGKMLITVGTRGARDGLRAWASGAGFVEGEDFLCVT